MVKVQTPRGTRSKKRLVLVLETSVLALVLLFACSASSQVSTVSPVVFSTPIVADPFPGSIPLVPAIGTSLSKVEEANSPSAVISPRTNVLPVGSTGFADTSIGQLTSPTETISQRRNQINPSLSSSTTRLTGGLAAGNNTMLRSLSARSLNSNLRMANGSVSVAGGLLNGSVVRESSLLNKEGFSLQGMQAELSQHSQNPMYTNSAVRTESSRYAKLDRLSPEALASQPIIARPGGLSTLGMRGLPTLQTKQPSLSVSFAASFAYDPTVVTGLPRTQSRSVARGGSNPLSPNGSGSVKPSLRVPTIGDSRLSRNGLQRPSIPKVGLRPTYDINR